MDKDQKEFHIMDLKTESDMNLDKKIRNNKIFAIAAFLIAGVAFGIGEDLFDSVTIQNIVAFGSLGVSCANIRALRENKKAKEESLEEAAKLHTKFRRRNR